MERNSKEMRQWIDSFGNEHVPSHRLRHRKSRKLGKLMAGGLGLMLIVGLVGAGVLNSFMEQEATMNVSALYQYSQDDGVTWTDCQGAILTYTESVAPGYDFSEPIDLKYLGDGGHILYIHAFTDDEEAITGIGLQNGGGDLNQWEAESNGETIACTFEFHVEDMAEIGVYTVTLTYDLLAP